MPEFQNEFLVQTFHLKWSFTIIFSFVQKNLEVIYMALPSNVVCFTLFVLFHINQTHTCTVEPLVKYLKQYHVTVRLWGVW